MYHTLQHYKTLNPPYTVNLLFEGCLRLKSGSSSLQRRSWNRVLQKRSVLSTRYELNLYVIVYYLHLPLNAGPLTASPTHALSLSLSLKPRCHICYEAWSSSVHQFQEGTSVVQCVLPCCPWLCAERMDGTVPC
jgi:hypothetical protein